jgi:hypothetical protein
MINTNLSSAYSSDFQLLRTVIIAVVIGIPIGVPKPKNKFLRFD